MRLVIKPLIWLFGMILGMVGLAALVWWLIVWTAPKEVTVPNILNLPELEARQLLRERGLGMKVARHEFSKIMPARRVLKIEGLQPGMRVRAGRVISVVLSRGPKHEPVPDVMGLALEQAVDIIQRAGMDVGNKVVTYNDTVLQGSVIGQQPAAGARVPVGTPVHLIVSKGTDPPLPSPLSDSGLVPPKHKAARVHIDVGKSPASTNAPLQQEVEIVVVDESGKHSVYKAVHAPGDSVERVVMGKGSDVKVLVFLNRTLYHQQNL